LKRGLDLVGSVAGLVLMSPLVLYIAVRIKLDSPGPVYFRQPRPGRDGAWFDIVKFRTMYVSGQGEDCTRELHGELEAEYLVKHKLANDPRVTPFGKWLRQTSLDELPQLWNVLRGEMSLVGPRPMLVSELERPDNVTRELLAVQPGMTGYWQVNGRSETDYDERLRLELSYVSNWSTRLDISILARTLPVIVSGQGAS
jgi:lipopolysaccharide/colanic/teichoic acid biosynthesis glycosyltransferase